MAPHAMRAVPIFFTLQQAVEPSIVMKVSSCPPVCLSARISLESHTSKLYQIFCACCVRS